MVCDSGGGDLWAAVGEALFAWESSEREVGEVLGGLGIDDYAVGGDWVGSRHSMRLPWITAAIVI